MNQAINVTAATIEKEGKNLGKHLEGIWKICNHENHLYNPKP